MLHATAAAAAELLHITRSSMDALIFFLASALLFVTVQHCTKADSFRLKLGCRQQHNHKDTAWLGTTGIGMCSAAA